jgi:hypothetical protein
MEKLKLINKHLLKVYGLTIDGQPKFRLVWSEDLLESRFGTFEDYTPGGIFLRREVGIRQVKKYSYLKDRFILEAYTPEQKQNSEIVNGDKYESLFVFDKKGQFLSPEVWACDYVISRYHLAMGGGLEKRTDSMDARAHEEEIDKEAQKFVEYMEGEDSEMMQSFRAGESVLIHREG